MQPTKIKILTKANGKRVAYYRNPNSSYWFSMTVADAVRAIREGRAHIGANTNVEVVAA